MFQFLRIMSSDYPTSKSGRQSIKEKLAEEQIAPSESSTSPGKLGRIVPSFWSILSRAKMQGVSLHNLSSHGCAICRKLRAKEFSAREIWKRSHSRNKLFA
ncbi:hypothetical protein POPTR_015G102501v4 [Populus trichocarpa]|uniref:Uncharacterized protein n=2 Tax=Populus trichocarpa TaxID=3694 RepID=A0A3N7G3D6_POPTR|nr:hypothetical protein BDE02_15G089000 [Populus trichocarpa]RQP00836.1 hypothetical protein POPTR_015G102501v4 [Populus trichocarpa]